MPHSTSDTTPYSRADWDKAYNACDAQGWEPDTEGAPDLVTALAAAYQTLKQDHDAVRATILAAAERFSDEWTVADLAEVAASFAVRMYDGWAELARDYLDDHYPGLPAEWLRDLDEIGHQVARPSEQYIPLDGELFIFNRP